MYTLDEYGKDLSVGNYLESNCGDKFYCIIYVWDQLSYVCLVVPLVLYTCFISDIGLFLGPGSNFSTCPIPCPITSSSSCQAQYSET